ncbi:CPBP family intramembrane metalloprotease [Streptomyces sp. NBC_01433]|uniref:CPBP family intramembrane glutamic endopeptidase n=1 Tax=Streptomyces sp. NBC_01433 TaxID=2903864 RepID=UPI0022584145|nr:CPBP family intramembrane glutamic endopeptidase [Streptomyces sp. NBC_01433]MCX4682242.1 CPBP family intramembrane metalloprotease [Streptomyces sp. NBC_01433]
MDANGTESVVDDRADRSSSIGERAGDLVACVVVWGAALMAAAAVQEVFTFLPGFVPWGGESPRSFLTSIGAAAGLVATAVFASFGAGTISVRVAGGRLVDGMGLRAPVSMRQTLRWAAVGAAAAVALWAMAKLLALFPGLTSVPAGEDPRLIAVAQTSTPIRFMYGLIAPAPLEELAFRGPLLALLLALLAAQHRGSWTGRRWVRWSLMGTAIAASAVVFAAGHTIGGSVNVAHAVANAVITTAVTLWQRSLFPAMAAHGLYDAWAFAWG